jgi:F-type H+-transporting ATPase subunit b
MELLSKLGIDWRLFIAQLINFLILVFVLYKFLYKPILNLLDSRKEKIEKGLRDAEKIGEELEKTKELHDKEIKKAKQEAMAIIEEAQRTAEAAGQETRAKTKAGVEKLITAAKNQIIQEKEKMFTEIKMEAAALVIAVAEKVVGKTFDGKTQQKLIEDSLREANKK